MVGRKKMIAGSFAMSGVFSATTQTIAWVAISFLHRLPKRATVACATAAAAWRC
jgi:hypothetical protein